MSVFEALTSSGCTRFHCLIRFYPEDGVMAGWEMDRKTKKFKIVFATPVHEGSVRSMTMAQPHLETRKESSNDDKSAGSSQNIPGTVLSCGYDEVLRTHDFAKRITSSGEVQTPAEFGTPVCSAFAPPLLLDLSLSNPHPRGSTHCLVGFSEGKLAIFKKRDWSVQHVLPGHDGGVACIAVHPSGKMALTGGESDGKLKLWDLTKGRLAFVSKIRPSIAKDGKAQYDAISNIVWTPDETGDQAYAFCYGNHITVRDVSSGQNLLDVDLPSRVNQVCLFSVEQGMFVAAACNDGSLPVLAVEHDKKEERRAIMAIEPVDGAVAGEERFKCIQSVGMGYVVTANSAGVVSLMDLRGAIRMISTDEIDQEPSSEEQEEVSDDSDDLAVDIIDGVQLGTGARVTCLAVWCSPLDNSSPYEATETEADGEANEKESRIEEEEVTEQREQPKEDSKKRPRPQDKVMDDDTLKRARALVASARKIQSRKKNKKKVSKSSN